MLLISDKAIEYQRYNDEKTEITWENCSLRKWLNEDFITEAFDSEEQKRIVETTLEADNNPQYKTDGGNDTTDKVFIKVGVSVGITGLYQSIHSFLKWGYAYQLLILSFII